MNNVRSSSCAVPSDLHRGHGGAGIFEKFRSYGLHLTLLCTLPLTVLRNCTEVKHGSCSPFRFIFCSWWTCLWVIFPSLLSVFLLLWCIHLDSLWSRWGSSFDLKLEVIGSTLDSSCIGFWVKSIVYQKDQFDHLNQVFSIWALLALWDE